MRRIARGQRTVFVGVVILLAAPALVAADETGVLSFRDSSWQPVAVTYPADATTVGLQLYDPDLDADHGAIESCQVACLSDLGDSETFTLTETGLGTGVFRGSHPFAVQAPAPGDGLLQVAAGSGLTAIYQDARNDWGAPQEVRLESLYGAWVGQVSGTWTAAAGPYVVAGNIEVPSGQTLTIEAGTDVQFLPNVSCYVGGVLDCRGAPADSVRLRLRPGSPPEAYWGGIVVPQFVDGTVLLSYASLDRAVRGVWMQMYLGSGRIEHSRLARSQMAVVMFFAFSEDSLVVTDSIIEGNGTGIDLRLTPGGLRLAGCTVRDNTAYGVYVEATPVQITASTFSGNGTGVLLAGSPNGIPTINGCELQGNAEYDLRNLTPSEIDARTNDWGPATTALMNAGGNPKDLPGIFDVHDDAVFGLVNYSRWEGAGGVFGATGGLAFTDAAGAPVVATYPPGAAALHLELVDPDRNANSGAVESCQAVCQSDLGDGEPVTLIETGPATGVFRGALPFQVQAPVAAGDGFLQVAPGDELTAIYQDPFDDWGGSEEVRAATAYGAWTGAVSGTWTAAGGPYVAVGDLAVAAGETLIVEAGADVRFAPGVSFAVGGLLDCRGTPADTVRLRLRPGESPGATWAGIVVPEMAEGDVRLSYVELDGAVSGLRLSLLGRGRIAHSRLAHHQTAVLAMMCDSLVVAGSVIEESGRGLDLGRVWGGARVEGCLVRNNAAEGIYADVQGMSLAVTGSVVTGNGGGVVLSGLVPAGPLAVTGCELHDNGEYDLQNLTPSEIDARYDDWGPATTAEMAAGGNPKNIARILDGFDDPSRGRVNYSRWEGAGGILGTTGALSFTDALGQPVGAAYPPGAATLHLELVDPDRNADGGLIESCQATCRSQLGDNEAVTLLETGPATGVFRGSMPFDPQVLKAYLLVKDRLPRGRDEKARDLSRRLLEEAMAAADAWTPAQAAGDGALQVLPGDSLAATWADPLNDWGAAEEVASRTWYGGWSGDVAGTWTAAAGPYVIVGDLQVPTGQSLTIEAGADVQFLPDVLFWVSGTLDCRGAAGDSVRLRPHPGDGAPWAGILVPFISEATVLLSHTRLEGAGHGVFMQLALGHARIEHSLLRGHQTALLLENCDSLVVTDSVIEQNGRGLDIRGLRGGARLDGCAVRGNELEGIYAGVDGMPLTITGSGVTDNGTGIVLHGVQVADSSLVIAGCGLHGNAGGDLRNLTPREVKARYNWWGPTTTAEMNAGGNPKDIAAIHDVHDSPGLGLVNYSQWLQYPPELDWCLPEPSGLTAAWDGISTIQLSWTDNSTDEARFLVDRRAPAEAVWTNVGTAPAGATGWSDTPVALGVTWFYRVRAQAASGCDAVSNVASATAARVPVAPSGLAAAPGPQAGILLSWQDNSDNEHGFEIQRQGAGKSEWSAVPAKPGAGTRSFEDSDLPAGVEFLYRVRAYVGAVYSAWSEPAGAVTPGEGPAFNPVVTVTLGGSPVAGVRLLLDRRDGDGPVVQPGTTDAQGRLQLIGVQVNHRLRAEKMILARAAEKEGHGAVDDLMYELWLDSDVIAADGSYRAYAVGGEQPAVTLALRHSVFRYNLLVAVEWDMPPGDLYWASLHAGFEGASSYLYDVSDGQLQFGKIAVYDNGQHWRRSDMRIYTEESDESDVPHADAGGIFDGKYLWWQTPEQMHFKWTYGGQLPSGQLYLRTIAHEFGHYGLGLHDEYVDGDGSRAAWDAHRLDNPDEVPGNYGLMDSQYNATEMSSANEYLRSYPEPLVAASVTRQYFIHRMSCWDWVERWLESQSPGVSIEKPQPGWYPDNRSDRRAGPWDDVGLVQDGWVVVDDDKRATPVVFQRFDAGPGSFTAEIQVVAEGRPVRDAAIHVRRPRGLTFAGRTDAEGRLVVAGLGAGDLVKAYPPAGLPGAAACESAAAGKSNRITLELARTRGALPSARAGDVRPPALQVDARPLGTSQSPTIALEIQADEPLGAPPVVTGHWGGWSGPVPLTLLPAEGRYVGSLIVSPADTLFDGSGSFEISAADTAANSCSFVAGWEVFPLPAGEPADLYAGSASLHVRAEDVQSERLALLMRCDAAALMPPGFAATPVGSQWSLHLDGGDGLTAGAVLNLEYPGAQAAGYDESALLLCRWDSDTGTWVEVAGAVQALTADLVSASINDGGAYRLFAPSASADLTPPARVLDLGAVEVQGHGLVQIGWTAPGDDGGVGQAVEYLFAWSDSAITTANWDDLPKLPGLASPGPAGSAELRTIALPEAGLTYRLALRAKDEAGNLSLISNVATARSGHHDPNGLPGPPRELRAVDRPADHGGAVRLTWEPSYDDGGGKSTVLGYRIFRNAPPELLPVALASVPAGTTAFVDSAVQDATAFTYWVSAIDSVQEAVGTAEAALAARNLGSPPCDFTSDGIVGVDDFALLVDAYATDAAAESFDPLFDLQGDGVVGNGDLALFGDAFGQGGLPTGSPGENGDAEVQVRLLAAGENLWHLDLLVGSAASLAGFSFRLDFPTPELGLVGVARVTDGEGGGFLASAGGAAPLLLVSAPAPGTLRVADALKGPLAATCPEGEGLLARVTLAGVSPAGITISEVVLLDHRRRTDWQDRILHVGEAGDLPARPRLHAAYPNPFNAEVLIEYELPREQRVDLRVYDVRGRLVAVLVAAAESGGRHRIAWDGRDREGRAAASGVYFYRFRTEGLTETRKLTLLK